MAAAERAAAAAPMRVVEVDLGDRTYPIYIGRGLLDQGELLRQHIPGKTALIVTNETVAPLYLERCVGWWGGCECVAIVQRVGPQRWAAQVQQGGEPRCTDVVADGPARRPHPPAALPAGAWRQ